MTFPYEVTVQSMRDIKSQVPEAICELTPTPFAINLLVNREAPAFNDPEIRRAMQLAIDRKSFIDILAEGQGDISGAMQPPPGGLWGLPPEILQILPGYGPDVRANRAEARKLMEKHGYEPEHRLPIKVATRNIAQYRDPAVILIDQMKEFHIDGELDTVETVNWFPKIARKDFMVGANLSGSRVDDRTPISTSIMLAAPSEITRITAIPSSKKCTSSGQSSPTRKSASWSGRSTGSCRGMRPARSSINTASAPAVTRARTGSL